MTQVFSLVVSGRIIQTRPIAETLIPNPLTKRESHACRSRRLNNAHEICDSSAFLQLQVKTMGRPQKSHFRKHGG